MRSSKRRKLTDRIGRFKTTLEIFILTFQTFVAHHIIRDRSRCILIIIQIQSENLWTFHIEKKSTRISANSVISILWDQGQKFWRWSYVFFDVHITPFIFFDEISNIPLLDNCQTKIPTSLWKNVLHYVHVWHIQNVIF